MGSCSSPGIPGASAAPPATGSLGRPVCVSAPSSSRLGRSRRGTVPHGARFFRGWTKGGGNRRDHPERNLKLNMAMGKMGVFLGPGADPQVLAPEVVRGAAGALPLRRELGALLQRGGVRLRPAASGLRGAGVGCAMGCVPWGGVAMGGGGRAAGRCHGHLECFAANPENRYPLTKWTLRVDERKPTWLGPLFVPCSPYFLRGHKSRSCEDPKAIWPCSGHGSLCLYIPTQRVICTRNHC